MKRKVIVGSMIFIVASFILAACGQGAAPDTVESGEDDLLTCAFITPNPLGDRSFVDSGARGIERANEELPVDCVIVETLGAEEFEPALRQAVNEGFDLILPLAGAIGPDSTIAAAEDNPDILFGAPSTDPFGAELDNVAGNLINVHESSFLVGLIAGSLTETKIVGAVVGGDAPGLTQFWAGYKQGVLEVCPDCEVLVSFLGFEFNDPALGLETALAMYDQGADIIYQIAGRTGEGVLEAAAQTGNYAIGVDSDQDWIQPGSVIVSMIKRVDTAVYRLIEDAVNDEFGGFEVGGLAEGLAGISWDEGSTTFADEGPEDLTSQLPEIEALVEDYRARITSGDYVVCDALAETGPCEGLY